MGDLGSIWSSASSDLQVAMVGNGCKAHERWRGRTMTLDGTLKYVYCYQRFVVSGIQLSISEFDGKAFFFVENSDISAKEKKKDISGCRPLTAVAA